MSYLNADDPQLLSDLRAALARWPQITLGEMPIATRLAAVDRHLTANPSLSRTEALRSVMQAALSHVRASGQADHAELLEQRYLHGHNICQMEQIHHLSERSLYYRLKEATIALAHALWTEEQSEQSGLTSASWRARHLPAPTYTQLFGIEELMVQLLERLDQRHDHWLISVEGMGGLGKTALAREAVGRLAETERFTDIAWVTAQQEFYSWSGLEQSKHPVLTFEQLLDAIADQVGNEDLRPLPLPVKKERIRALLQTCPYLVVVDNLETALDCDTLPAQLWELVNPSKFLLTSRHRVTRCAGVSALSLGELADSAGLAFIRYEGLLRGLQEIAEASDEALRPILTATGGHPLAIKLVVGQLTSLPLSQVIASLETTQPGADPFYRFLYHRSWSLLTEKARHLLLCLTLMPTSGGAWEDLAAVSGLPNQELAVATAELTSYSLLQAVGLEEKTYTIHRLTHNFVAGQVAGQPALAESTLRAGKYYLAYVRRHHRDWTALAHRQDHTLYTIRLCGDLGPEGQRIAIECVRMLHTYMDRKGYWTVWEQCVDLALRAAADLSDERAQADLWNKMGTLKTRQGELGEALDLHRRAAKAFRCLEDDLNRACALRWQGNAYYTQSDRPAALICYKQARDLLSRLDEPVELSHIHNNIANVYLQEGDWDQAQENYERALVLLDPERDRRHILTLLNNMGFLYWEMGHWQRAADTLLQALPMSQALGDRIGQANTYHYLCRVYTDLQVWEQALSHGLRALVLRKALKSAEGMADIYTALATIYLRVGDSQKAEGYLALAEPLWQEANRPGGVARVWLARGDLHGRAGAWVRAQEAYEEALALLEQDKDPPRWMTALVGLANAYFKTGNKLAAQTVLARAEALADELARPDLRVRVLWLQSELDPSVAHHALAKAVSLCQISGADNDRLNWLCEQIQASLSPRATHIS